MTKKKKLVKIALKHPELYSAAEVEYFRKWLKQHKYRKQQEKEARKGLQNV